MTRTTTTPRQETRAGAGHAPAGTTRRLVAALVATLTGLALTITAPAPAVAAPGAECPVGQTDCSVWDDDPGTPGSPGDPGGGDDGGGDHGGGPAKCQWNGKPIACYDDYMGWFNNSDGCYYKLAQPQPPDVPAGKQRYVRHCNGGDLGSVDMIDLDAPPPGFGAPPDPEELAFRALASIRLLRPGISVAPRKSQGPGLVGLPVWMWASPGPNYFGELFASASERGLTVTITAKVREVVWNMGNGETVTCTVPGTPYSPSGPRAGQESPDCGYPGYDKAGTYTINATTHWVVAWEGGGESGTIPAVRTSRNVEVQINELQVVTR
ncbi:hypothetical protein CA850_15850 [Micromonospora echinospora]|uniref:hypothetical protein n=1 Tax=Micromonospora echinospora TaxID=1877 RepID=UPI000B5B07DD|nr:hypothetical protein CA850_15850 [Micromonospora echinospora]